MKVLTLDIESMPNMVEVMKYLPRLGDYPGLTLKATINSVLCFGYKFENKKVQCINAWDFPTWEKSVNDDLLLLKEASKVIQQADVVVTHNGKRFDWKFLQTRLLFHHLPPLPKIIHIDTCSESKKHLLSFNNRLATLTEQFSEETKMDNTGWKLWVDVMNKKPEAMKLMQRYCKQDVVATESLYKRLRPMIDGLPTQSVGECNKCHSRALTRRGPRRTRTGTVQTWQCQQCGAWSTSKMGHQMGRHR